MLRADARTYSPGDRVLLQIERSTVSTSASHSISGSFFPRFSALRKIPSQALALKKYFSGALSCKIADKEDSAASLGDSPVLGVQHSPRNRITFSHDATGVSPSRFSCLTPPTQIQVHQLRRHRRLRRTHGGRRGSLAPDCSKTLPERFPRRRIVGIFHV